MVSVYQLRKSVRGGILEMVSDPPDKGELKGVFSDHPKINTPTPLIRGAPEANFFTSSLSRITDPGNSVRARASQRISRSSRSISLSCPNTEIISTRSFAPNRIETMLSAV